MKKSKTKYLINTLIVAIGVAGFLFYSCEKEETAQNKYTPTLDPEDLETSQKPSEKETGNLDYSALTENSCGEVETLLIQLADGETVGNAVIFNDEKYFYINLLASRGYFFSDAFMHISYSSDKIPLDENGNPDIQSFSHVADGNTPAKFQQLKVDLSQIKKNSFVVAVACETHTDPNWPGKQMLGWIDGKQFGNLLKGQAFKYNKSICTETTPVQDLVDE